MARPRKPTKLHVLTGTARPSRHNLKAEKDYPSLSECRPPAHLSGVGRRAYKRFFSLLHPLGVLTETDGPALEAMAAAYEEMRHCLKICAEQGYTVEGATGALVRRPEATQLSQSQDRLMKWLSHFGMTPSTRAKIAPSVAKTADPFADYMEK